MHFNKMNENEIQKKEWNKITLQLFNHFHMLMLFDMLLTPRATQCHMHLCTYIIFTEEREWEWVKNLNNLFPVIIRILVFFCKEKKTHRNEQYKNIYAIFLYLKNVIQTFVSPLNAMRSAVKGNRKTSNHNKTSTNPMTV